MQNCRDFKSSMEHNLHGAIAWVSVIGSCWRQGDILLIAIRLILIGDNHSILITITGVTDM